MLHASSFRLRYLTYLAPVKWTCSFNCCYVIILVHVTDVITITDCVIYETENECETQSKCSWSLVSGCYCASNLQMDICFALDSSGSIGSEYFDIELDWLSNFVQSGLTQNTRIGIINFSTDVDVEMNFRQSESYSSTQLANFILNNIPYLDSFTNTVDALEEAIDMFDAYSSDETTKILIILTDGNPKMPGNGDEDVCQWESEIKSNNIRTVIAGIGDNWDQEKVECLVSNVEDDIMKVSSFNYSAFNRILPYLTSITCQGMNFFDIDIYVYVEKKL